MKIGTRSDMALKTFLSRCAPEKQRELERFLPEEKRIQLEKITPFDLPILPEKFDTSEMVETVHWSWFLPTLRTYQIEEQKLFLSALSPKATKNLAKSLKITSCDQDITQIANAYLRQILSNSLLGPKDQLLPTDYLPKCPLTPLLSRSKKELVHIIDLLSLYDLGEEQKKIVETKILKKIYSFLSVAEKSFLKKIQGNKESFNFPRMGLDRWDGTEESFRLLLHRRGLARFGAALSGQNPDFIWHICHQLDIGRGNTLFKMCEKEATPGISNTIIRHIEELL